MVDCAKIVDRLELALIELEYAAADFAHKKSATDAVELRDLVEVQRKMQAATRAMDLAIQLLAATPKARPRGTPLM